MHYKGNLQEVTGEYLYYKGIIRGLEEAKNKTPKAITALQNIYSVKTKHIDKLIGDEK